jgi:hypothetical protein
MSSAVRAVRNALPAVVIGFVAAMVLRARIGPAARDVVWAEDGAVFLDDRLSHGAIRSLLLPYDGYLHVIPRLLVDVAALAPIEAYARVVALLGCLVAGAVCAAIWVLSGALLQSGAVPHSGGWIGSGIARLVASSAPVLVPLAPYEIGGNAANLHWHLLFVMPWLLLRTPRTVLGACVAGVAALLVALSEIQAAMFVPLVVFRFRDRLRWPAAIGLALGIASQIVCTIASPRPSGTPSTATPADLVVGFIAQPVHAMVTADVPRLAAAAHGLHWGPMAVVVVALVGLLCVAMVRATTPERWLLGALAGASGVVWSAGILVNGSQPQQWASYDAAALAAIGPLRYAAASSVFLWATVAVAAGVLLRGSVRACSVLVVAVFLVVAASGLDARPTRRSGGPLWTEQVTAARAACRTTPAAQTSIAAAPALPKWAVTIPCDRLR